MTQPPSIPIPPVPMSSGLDDLDDTPEGTEGATRFDTPGSFALEQPEPVQPQLDHSAAESAAAAAEANEEGKPKRGPRVGEAQHPATLVDWTKVQPRSADQFEQALPSRALNQTTDQLRNFFNWARDNNQYGQYYMVLSYKVRSSAQQTRKSIQKWSEGKANKYGIRDGETADAKNVTNPNTKEFEVWAALLIAPATPTLPEGITPPPPPPSQ